MAVIGFLITELSGSEGIGSLDFDIGVLQGILRINVGVNFATDDGSAQGMPLSIAVRYCQFTWFTPSAAGLDYDETTSSLVFTDRSTESVPVGIIDNSFFESNETFFGQLTAASVLPPTVHLDPIEAVATILDNDIFDNDRTYRSSLLAT